MTTQNVGFRSVNSIPIVTFSRLVGAVTTTISINSNKWDLVGRSNSTTKRNMVRPTNGSAGFQTASLGRNPRKWSLSFIYYPMGKEWQGGATGAAHWSNELENLESELCAAESVWDVNYHWATMGSYIVNDVSWQEIGPYIALNEIYANRTNPGPHGFAPSSCRVSMALTESAGVYTGTLPETF